MKWNERAIARLLATEFFQRKYLVMVPNCNWTGHECDVLAVTENLRIVDVEIKISRSDLKADAKKDKWWERRLVAWGHEERKFSPDGRLISVRQPPVYSENQREHPPRVWKHYYCLPREIWKDELLAAMPSKASGVLLVYERNGRLFYDVKRRATSNKDADRIKPEEAVNLARLASLRMWDAYSQADQAQAESRHWYQQVRSLTGDAAA